MGRLTYLDIGQIFIQADTLYRPASLAKRLLNMGVSEDPGNTLLRCGDTAPLEPGLNLAAYVLGLAHLELAGGANQITLIRYGDKLGRHQGWTRSVQVLESGLTYDLGQPYPDSMVAINGRVCWSNGVDAPLLIDGVTTYGRQVIRLGFDRAPAAPTVLYPSGGASSSQSVPNYAGYAHVGGIGTVQSYDGEDGALLAGAWGYRVQWEDPFGNLSPASAEATAALRLQSTGYLVNSSADYERLNHLDSMTRQFCLRGIDPGEEHVGAIRVYRTTDKLHTDGAYYLLARLTGREAFGLPDGESDGLLSAGPTLVELDPVTPYRVACEFQGRLVAANFNDNPGMIRLSEPGFPGTWPRTARVIPDAGGAAVTGLAATAGGLLAFTANSIFQVEATGDVVTSRPLIGGVGCVAPATLAVLPNGDLIWMAMDGVYTLSGGVPARVSDPIRQTYARLPSSYLGRAVGAVDPRTGVYVLAVCTGSSPLPDQLLLYDVRTGGWSESDAGGRRITALAAAPGHARHLLMGSYLGGEGQNVRIWNRPSVIEGDTIASAFESGVVRMGEDASVVFRLRGILIHFVESAVVAGGSATLRVWVTDRPDGEYRDYPIDLCGGDIVAADAYGGATVGSTIFRQPQIRCRKVDIDINNIAGFRFSLSSTSGRVLHLVGFAFLVERQDNNKSRIQGALRGA